MIETHKEKPFYNDFQEWVKNRKLRSTGRKEFENLLWGAGAIALVCLCAALLVILMHIYGQHYMGLSSISVRTLFC